MSLISSDSLSKLVTISSDAIDPAAALPGRLGEWEERVARRVLRRLNAPAWQELAAHAELHYQLSALVNLKVYPEQSREWIASLVVQGGYPLHPAAHFVLPRLSAMVGTPSRNAFAFFGDTGPGGFGYFLHNFTVAQPSGRLSLYTLEQLYTYFRQELAHAFPEAQEVLERAVAAASDVPLARSLLRTTCLLQLVDHDRMTTTAGTVLWALHLGKRETEIAGASLESLVQRRWLHLEPQSGRLSLPWSRPIHSATEVLRAARAHLPEGVDAFALLQQRFPPTRRPARAVNQKLFTDRFFLTALVRPADVSRTHGEALTRRLEALVGQPYQGDLLVLLLVPEAAEELEDVRQFWAQGHLQHPRLVLALPRQPADFAPEANRVAAIERALTACPPFNDPTSRRHAELRAELEQAREALDQALREHLGPENLVVLAGGEVLEGPDEEAFERFLNQRLDALLGEPPVLPHTALSTVSDPAGARRLRRRAVDYLAACRGPLALQRGADNVLWQGLVQTGLAKLAEEAQEWSFFRPAKAPGRLGQLVASLEPGPAAPIVARLTAYPCSLPASSVEFLLAYWLWSHSELSLKGPQGEVPAGWESLSQMVRSPEGWSLSSQARSPEPPRLEPAPLEESSSHFREGLTQGLRELFGGAPWPIMVYRWFSSLPPQVRDQAAQDDLQLLLSAYSSTSRDEDECLEDMLFELGYGPPEQWEQDHSAELLARLQVARAELESRAGPGCFPTPEEGREEFARHCIRYALEQARLPVSTLAEILQHHMEQVAFSSSSEQRAGLRRSSG